MVFPFLSFTSVKERHYEMDASPPPPQKKTTKKKLQKEMEKTERLRLRSWRGVHPRTLQKEKLRKE